MWILGSISPFLGFRFAVFASLNNNANEHICALSRRFRNKLAVLQLLPVSIIVAMQQGVLIHGPRMQFYRENQLLLSVSIIMITGRYAV